MFAGMFDFLNGSDFIDAGDILVHEIGSVVKSLGFGDLGEELFDITINGWDQGDGFVSVWLDFESDKVENFAVDFIGVDFSVPDLNVDD